MKSKLIFPAWGSSMATLYTNRNINSVHEAHATDRQTDSDAIVILFDNLGIRRLKQFQ